MGGVPVVLPDVMILRGIDVIDHLLKGKELSVSLSGYWSMQIINYIFLSQHALNSDLGVYYST